jgi:hypothetical protein
MGVKYNSNYNYNYNYNNYNLLPNFVHIYCGQSYINCYKNRWLIKNAAVHFNAPNTFTDALIQSDQNSKSLRPLPQVQLDFHETPIDIP